MQGEKMNLTDKLFEYNLWANTQLIALCGTLNAEQLGMEMAGVFGRIKPTLIHTISAEGGYLNRVTGSRPWADDLDWEALSFAELLEKAVVSGQKLVEVASKVALETQLEVKWEENTYHFQAWTVLIQALYHGIEHRTQVKMLLTQLGVKHPDLDAWGHSESLSG